MGFPGVGWLFAGFPLAASILLMVGPATAWAGVPLLFSPYGGPLRDVGWKIELVYLPVSALLSAAFLYRAHARRRARLDDPPPRGRRRRTASYRTRVGIAVGAIALLLVSLPFVPAVAGIGTSGVRYTYQTSLPRDVTGQFLRTPRGPVKLFAWGDPQTSYPAGRAARARDRRALTDGARRGGRRPEGVRRLRPRRRRRPFVLPSSGVRRRRSSSSRRGRSVRDGTRSSRRTRACSAAVTSTTSGSSARRRR